MRFNYDHYNVRVFGVGYFYSVREVRRTDSLDFLLICSKFNIFTNFDHKEKGHAQSLCQVASSLYKVCHYQEEKFVINGTHKRSAKSLLCVKMGFTLS